MTDFQVTPKHSFGASGLMPAKVAPLPLSQSSQSEVSVPLKEELLKLISPSAPSFRVLRDVQFLKVLAFMVSRQGNENSVIDEQLLNM